jgi:shikimate dehydrogenase
MENRQGACPLGNEEKMAGVKGTTRVCGIIGNPVEHSVSPVLQNMLAELLGLDLVYVPFRVGDGDVAAAVKGAYALNVLGMNVTVPHKSSVISELVDIDPLAESIGAVNTLVRVDGGYKGYNTDILGLKRELLEAGIALAGENVVILGAGGAARAIAFLCASEGAQSIYILNRTLEKASGIADSVNAHVGRNVVHPMAIGSYANLPVRDFLCIQTTSVGLHPHDDEAPIEDMAFYDMVRTGVDIIYTPAETRFMRLVRQSGDKRTYNGLKMLLYQGISAFELWNDVKVTPEMADRVYEALKKTV